MNTNRMGYIAAAFVAGVLLTAAAANIAFSGRNDGFMNAMGMRQGTGMGGSAMDRHFIEQMIPHHDDAITMAALAVQKAEHDEIKNLAKQIMESQAAEIDQMRDWYRSWYGESVPDRFISSGHGMGSGQMHMGMAGTEEDVRRLESAQPFDRAFLEAMIPHHQMAVMMAQMLEKSTARPEMKTLARNIIEAQNAEIEQMRAWYGQWYR